MKEIGSEFWLDKEYFNSDVIIDETYVLSGRTAIDLIIKDIQKTRIVKNVYLPAYCCDSMIDPFLKNGIHVELYDIRFDGELKYLIDEDKNCDIFYVTNYFGYDNNVTDDVILHFKQRGAITIYDKTHSLFLGNDFTNDIADYTFASIRKWMGVICGAIIEKNNNYMDVELNDYPYLRCKIEAMQEKAKFIKGDSSIDKQHFLNKYGEFSHHLSEEYQGYKMDEKSIAIWKQTDSSVLRNKRLENAMVLHSAKELTFINKLNVESCPIFVPVFFNTTAERDTVRKHLIEQQIYCPVHWPKNKFITSDMEVNMIFDTELSLVCDQRYTTTDMNRVISTIKEITNSNQI